MPSERERVRVELVRQATRATSESFDGAAVVAEDGKGEAVWFGGVDEADVVRLTLLAGADGETAILIASDKGATAAGM